MPRRRRSTKPGHPAEARFPFLAAIVGWTLLAGHGRWLVGLLVFAAVSAALVAVLRGRLGTPAASGPRPKSAPRPTDPAAPLNPIEQPLDFRSRREPQMDTAPAPAEWSLDLIRRLEWRRFEQLCEELWRALGYRVEITGAGADGGIDLKLYKPAAPERLLIIVQAKSRSREKIGVATVRELFGVMHHVQAPMGVLMTSTGYFPDALAFARGKHLQLIGGNQILDRLRSLDPVVQQHILCRVTAGDYTTPTCPSCEIKMTRRQGRAATEFWGCLNFPRCSYRQAVRSTNSIDVMTRSTFSA